MRRPPRRARLLDDYACTALALLDLYGVTLREPYLARAERLLRRAVDLFYDAGSGGFFLSGRENEKLLFRPKETYDGALPSGNAVMTELLVRLDALLPEGGFGGTAEKQLAFMCGASGDFPMGHAAFLCALSERLDPPAACDRRARRGRGCRGAAVSVAAGGRRARPARADKGISAQGRKNHLLRLPRPPLSAARQPAGGRSAVNLSYIII